MTYIILAQICLTIGAPNWVVTLCYVCFGLKLFQAISAGVIKAIKHYKENYQK